MALVSGTVLPSKPIDGLPCTGCGKEFTSNQPFYAYKKELNQPILIYCQSCYDNKTILLRPQKHSELDSEFPTWIRF